MEEHIMKKNLWILGGLVAMAFTACTNDDVLPADNTLASGKKVQVTAYAPGDGADSRIAFNDNEGTISLSWENSERFSVIRGGENQTFSNGESGGNIFEGDLPTAEEGTYYAVYPANTLATNHTAVPYDLSVQTGAMNSNSTYMYASSETTGDATSFQFQHATAVLKATFSGLPDDVEIKQVVVTTAVNKVDGIIDLTNGTMTPGSKNSISINFGENPVQKNAAVYIYLPPMEAAQKTLTFHVEVNDDNWYSATLPGTNGKDIVAGMLYTVDVQEVLPNCLIFEAEEDGQYLNIWPGMGSMMGDEEELNLQYSTNGTNWTDLESYTAVDFVDKKLFLRGTAVNGTNGATIKFDNSKTVACSGDIRTLMNYKTYSNIQTSGNFQSLFSGCRSLTTAPALPATTLTFRCYESMFSGCTSLTTAPELNATTLASSCYSGMFSGCTSLNAAPALNAENLDYMCYYYMFKDCTALTSAPALPATTLTPQCYESMFQGCTKLTTAPALPATILAERCYFGMFSGCALLITAPELKAATLAGACYWNMFSGCTSLITAPELPATNLEGNCYRNMFSGCTSLTTAPELKAATLANYCYYEMFSGCTNLSSVTMLATNISAENCLKNWLEGVASSGTFTKAASMTSLPSGTSGIPAGWTVENQ